MKKYILLLMIFLNACAFTQNSKFYRLQSLSQGKIVSNLKTSVGVEEVSIPRYVDRPQMVIFKPNTSELNISEFHRWAEPLSFGLTRILADDISLYLPNALVKPQSYSMENFNYTVTVEFNKFDAIMDAQATLDAWWTIFKNTKAVARGRTTISHDVKGGYDGIVIEQSKLLSEMARQIAQKISQL
ncbi:MAG: membrane integrity-associated transporter subunit PqiC [Alphaproteobacteria bacterium]|nr:membrane integrity-associated transporter subunit PqiC [Alphaproteobacteria bacterium]